MGSDTRHDNTHFIKPTSNFEQGYLDYLDSYWRADVALQIIMLLEGAICQLLSNSLMLRTTGEAS